MHSPFSHIIFAVILLLIVEQSKSEIQLVIVQEGDTATLRFNTSWPSTYSIGAVPYFTLRFESRYRPFYIDGRIDPPGLLHSSQYDRFTVIPQRNSESFVVNLIIQDVIIHDIGSYVFTFFLFGFSGDFYSTERISLQVIDPPGKAECFIQKDKEIFWPKVHCRATAGSGNATLSCFQDNIKVPSKGEIVRNGDMIRGISRMISSYPIHCCSHEWRDVVTQDSCLDFVFQSQPNITTTTLDTPESKDASVTISHLDRRHTEHVQEETLANRSLATRKYPKMLPSIIFALLVSFLSGITIAAH